MSSFHSKRLTIARNRRRLTKKELARRAGTSALTITRLETGATQEPESGTVEMLARALSFPAQFFYGDELDVLLAESASFRSLSSMTARERDAAIAAGSIAFLFADWVDARFNLPEPDIADLRHEQDPISAASALRGYWRIGTRPIGNLVKLLESKGVRVFSLGGSGRAVDAFSCWRNDVPFVFLNTNKSAERSRFDAAHELAHLVLHRHGQPRGQNAEREADTFASAFLMPREDVLSHLPRVRSLQKLIREKRRWGVSVAALAYMLHRLGLVSDWQYRALCKQISRNGYRTTEPNSMPREASVLWPKVLKELWKDRITKESIVCDLDLPIDELEGLLSGLYGDSESLGLRDMSAEFPELRAIDESG